MKIPAIGSVWIDKDPRMKGTRRVVVEAADEHFVAYRTIGATRSARSRTARFIKSFQPEAPQ